MNAPLVQANDLAMSFDVSAPWLNRVIERKPRLLLHAVDGVSFTIARGQTLALVGESGCGKSTVARLLVGLHEPTRGQFRFDGQDAHAVYQTGLGLKLRRRIQMIFQDPYASLNPRWRVEDIIAEPLREHGLLSDNEAVRERVEALLYSVGLAAPDRIKYPHQFSGGQRQRIGIARALALNPEFLVADEPVSALDVSIQSQILNLMMDLQEKMGLSYLFISHDLSVVKHISHRIGVMYLGSMVELANKKDLYLDPIHPYTRALLSAIPVPNPEKKKEMMAIIGEIPSNVDTPVGCKFHTRCPHAKDVCRHDEPDYLEVKPEHFVACHFAGVI